MFEWNGRGELFPSIHSSRVINRGGLFEISNETFHVIGAIKLETFTIYPFQFSEQVRWLETSHYWCYCSWYWCTICMGQPIIRYQTCHPPEIIGLWLTICGFSIVMTHPCVTRILPVVNHPHRIWLSKPVNILIWEQSLDRLLSGRDWV